MTCQLWLFHHVFFRVASRERASQFSRVQKIPSTVSK